MRARLLSEFSGRFARMRIACLGFFLVAAGCSAARVAMYAGPELPPARTATIGGYFVRDDMVVTIESVDGIRVPGREWFRGGIYDRDITVVVEPGPRQIDVRFAGFLGAVEVRSPVSVPLKVEVEAGRAYQVRVTRDLGTFVAHPETLRRVRIGGMGAYSDWVFWIIDLETEQRVPLLEIPAEQEERNSAVD